MDVIDAVCLWAVHRRMRRLRQMRERKYWVHPILKTRLSDSLYVTLYPKLREHDEKFFNYFRMSIKSFDGLLEIIIDSIEADENSFINFSISISIFKSIVHVDTRVSTEWSDNETWNFNPRCHARVRAEIDSWHRYRG